MLRRSTRSLSSVSLLAILALLLSLSPMTSHADLFDDGTPIPIRFDDRLPVLDSPSGLGQHLPAHGEVSLPAGDDEAHSALVRLSVFNAADDLQVLAAGAPALGGGGSRDPELAQAGGPEGSNLDAALDAIREEAGRALSAL